MLGVKARRGEVAKRYGSVLFTLAQENKNLKPVLKDVSRLHRFLQDEPLEWSRVTSPIIPLHVQRHVVDRLTISLKLGSSMSQFLQVLCDNRRLQNLKSILEAFLDHTQEAEGVVEGILETATKLSKAEIGALQKSLKHQLGKNISLHQEINDKLLGGVVLHLGSIMIDASLGTWLNKLRYAMKG